MARPPLGIEVDVVNLAEVHGDIAAIEQRAGDFRPAFRFFDRKHVDPFFRQQFESAGAHGGQPWEPLTPSGIRSRLATRGGNRGGVSRPLWDFGELKASLDAGGGQGLRVYERKHYAHGTRLERGAFHQEGAGSLPERVIIPDPWPGFLQRQWEVVSDRWLTTGFIT